MPKDIKYIFPEYRWHDAFLNFINIDEISQGIKLEFYRDDFTWVIKMLTPQIKDEK